jgi:1-acyl-sn-glycerol-3-phosphate acyltransferase
MSKTPWLIKLVRPTYGKWLLRHYDVRLKGYEHIPKEGPFLMIGNHVHTYDSLFLSAASSFHVHWVMGAYLFKIRFLRYLFNNLLQGISKQQGRSDLITIKGIRARLNEGGVVGFFPEGTRTWDGESIPINNATAKLLRLFNVPVVVVHFEGAYGSRPRWAPKKRKGPITINVVKVLQKEDLRDKSVEDVVALVNTYLVHSYDDWQKEHHVPYYSKQKAKGIENILYGCPSCNSFSTIEGDKNEFSCKKCNSTWKLNEYDEIIAIEDSPSYPTISQWHKWEVSYLKELSMGTSTIPLFPFDDGVLFQHATSTQLILLSKDFSLTATSTAFVLNIHSFEKSQITFETDEILFYYDNINSIVINAKSTLEFSYINKIYRVRIKPNQSILKYMELYQIHQKMILKESV